MQAVPPVGVTANSLTASSCPTPIPPAIAIASPRTPPSHFNALGQLTKVTDPRRWAVGLRDLHLAYDGDGNQTSVTQPPASAGGANQVTSNTYNAAGELATQTTGSGTTAASTISYCYDPDGNETSVVYAGRQSPAGGQCETSSPWVVSSIRIPPRPPTRPCTATTPLASWCLPRRRPLRRHPGGATTTNL